MGLCLMEQTDRSAGDGIEAQSANGAEVRQRPRTLCIPALRLAIALFALSLTAVMSRPASGGDHPSGRLSFTRDIRPILSDACFQCHGPDSAARKGGLRLDQRAEVFRSRRGRFPIVAGAPDRSELFLRITAAEESSRMPPEDSARQLSPQEIELIREWILAGSVWEEHWAYSPIVLPQVPTIEDSAGFVRNRIDAFVLAEMQKHGLSPSPDADRRTLIRRLYFDVIGLPPTPAEVDEFLADPAPDAWERLVDRTLASPRFGERMALFWLDLVRYADTNGYLGDRHEDRDPYRDWVISAFNRDMPFDRFTREQLAGDLLPDANDNTRIASGYNRLLMTTREAGGQPKEYLARYSADRVRNFSAVWLASTMACAACHDHKYDPFRMRDFYGLAAVFADIQEVAVGAQPQTRFPTTEQTAQLAALDDQIAAQQLQLQKQSPELDEAQRRWEASLLASPVDWKILRPHRVESFTGTSVKVLDDGSIRLADSPAREIFTLSFRTPWKDVAALRLEAIPDAALPSKGPGWGDGGAFVVTEVKVSIDGKPLKFARAAATHSSTGFGVEAILKRDMQRGWGVLDQAGISQSAILEFATVSRSEKPVDVQIALHHEFGDRLVLGRFQLSTSSYRSARPEGKSAVPSSVWQAIKVDPRKRSADEKEVIRTCFRSISPELAPVRERLTSLTQRRNDVESSVRKSLISTSGPPREIRILPRGDWLDDSGEIASPRTPDGLYRTSGKVRGRMTRLELAEWVTSPNNPLPPRVLVNRLWRIAFGQGIVRTLEDFGSQGTPPTHAELLDWLAHEFVSPGAASTEGQTGTGHSERKPRPAAGDNWAIKPMLRLMLTSGTYRQSSVAARDSLSLDPDNLWFARQSRERISAEMIRDNALAVSGLLSATIGGKSVKPFQPERYWSLLNREWHPDPGEGQYRRGLYTYWCRTFLHPSLKAFDATTREECTAERSQSNTPLQALVLLNDPSYIEAARALAIRILRDGGDSPVARLTFAFQHVLSRPPRASEIEILSNLYTRHMEQYAADPQSAAEILAIGDQPVASEFPPAEIAAWMSLTRVLLNLHEAITRN